MTIELTVDRDIRCKLTQLASETMSQVLIASAYCKIKPFFQYIIKNTLDVSRKELYLRWQIDDLVNGASDLEVYKAASEFGWNVYINQRLHAKTYCFDQQTIIGSANLTRSGIDDGGNHECIGIAQTNKEILDWFAWLKSESVQLTDELFSAIEIDIKENKEFISDSNIKHIQYSEKVKSLLKSQRLKGIFTEDFIWTKDPSAFLESDLSDPDHVHDLNLLGLSANPTKEETKRAFMRLPAFEWLEGYLELNSHLRFGELTHRLHRDLLDDPAPYRKTVKALLSNLLAWCDYFASDRVLQVQSAHTSLISKKL